MVILDILLSGLVLGGVYGLVAMGLSVQYGVSRIMNLAYGEMLVAAAFLTMTAYLGLAITPLAGLLAVVPLAFALNWLIYLVLLRPLARRAASRAALEADSILATFGLLFVVQGVLLVLFGGAYQSYSFLAWPVPGLPVTVAANKLAALGFAVAAGTLIYLGLTRTRAGTALRAVAVDPLAARLVGIDVDRASAFAFALGGALVAAGGVLISMFLTFNAASGVIYTMKALVVTIMGGVGHLAGALIAGLLLGLVETLVIRLIDPGLSLASNYLLFLAVILWRPQGLFGRAAS